MKSHPRNSFYSGVFLAVDVSAVAEGVAVRPQGLPRGGRLRGERQRRREEQRRTGQGAEGMRGLGQLICLFAATA